MITLAYKPKPYKPDKEFLLTDNQKVLLMPVGDVHEGSRGWPRDKFIKHLEWGMERGATFLGMGEIFDFTSGTQREIAKQFRDSTKDIIDGFIKERIDALFKMISFTKGHWIGLLEGHHFWQFENGTTSDQHLCQLLNCHFLGTSTQTCLNFNIAKHPEADCVVYAHHGVGSAQTSGGKLNKVEDLIKKFEADIYLMGHVHTKVSDPIDRQYITPDGIHYHRTKLIARTGGFQLSYLSTRPQPLTSSAAKSRGTYVEAKAMTPTSLGGLAIGIGYERISGSGYYRPTIHYSA